MYYNTDAFLIFWNKAGCEKNNHKRERREIFYI